MVLRKNELWQQAWNIAIDQLDKILQRKWDQANDSWLTGIELETW